MILAFENLNSETRTYMLQEIDRDISNNTLYLSKWLTDEGQQLWPQLLRDAAQTQDDEWLADQVRARHLLRPSTTVRTRSGGTTQRRMSHDAPEVIVHEFNMFYVRALCAIAVANSIPTVTIYRAKEVADPRPSSATMIGSEIDAAATLADLRETHGTQPRLGFPAGPNTGLTVKLLRT